ncbi:hypothetical protein ERX46_16185 [Brumimicrobium glaciale]|uniref:DUF1801 domain-containing protein n=1 Tax=Brumimicrobium glaciale TaxID=200475 RepID=A0A4Q4KFY3_9FLAO|nr:hypothetical protein [Brumimicrobium glaciale]RYM31447.1 hypothetical protein ERX46_16185 [Brumimicrobium glaciale]
MIKDISEIREKLKKTLESFLGPLKVKVNKPANFELMGTIETYQGKQKVEGIYFSSLVPKEKDVRLYFFPAYTHPQEFENLSETLKKFKKGKSCFHIKYLDEELENEIQNMISKGVELYKKDGWLE